MGWCLLLDFLTVPAAFLNDKGNARFHLKFVCPLCPKFRRKLRDVDGNGKCWWFYHWKDENYEIPRTFGLSNSVRQYFSLKTNLDKFQKLSEGL